MPPELPRSACAACLARSFLLGALSARIEHSARDLPGLLALLRHDDEQLIRAIAGRHRDALLQRRRELVLTPAPARRDAQSVCPHSTGVAPVPPTVLHVQPSVERFCAARSQPVVAIVGSLRATEYGRQVAARLATELASAGVTVAALLVEGVAATAHEATLADGGAPLAICTSGLDRSAKHLGRLHARIVRRGCLLAELPAGIAERRSTRRAAGRVLVEIADLVLLVEGEPHALELELAEHARSLGRQVGAVPGRVGHRRSEGPHAMLRTGAALIASAQEVLDLLHGVGTVTVPARAARIQPSMRAVLDRVCAGEDTLDALLRRDGQPAQTLLALGELEALGLLVRGASGRYLACA
ncbi:MAG: DNA-processing protein DprA [Solirubrobacteraceae bacterium]